MSGKVHVSVLVDYRGTVISKAITVDGDETDAVKVNRALANLSARINGMVQMDQSVTTSPQGGS